LQVLPSGDFLVASPLSGTISRFGPDGTERWNRRGGLEAPSDFENPAAVTRAPGSNWLLIQDGFSRFFIADLEGTVLRRHFLGDATADRPALSFVPPAFATRDCWIEGLAMFRSPAGGAPQAGLVAAALEGDGWRGPFAAVSLQAPEFIAFSLESRMVAATGEGVVMLVNGVTHELRWLEKDSVRTVPLRFDGLDAYPRNLRPGASAMGAVHQALRGLRLPVGVYWDSSETFVLVARPNSADGRRTWELVAVDPGSGRPARRLRLPTDADEIGLSVGSEHWILLEKRVEGVEGTQRGISVVRIPAEWFRAPKSPLAVESTESPPRCAP